MTFYDFYDTGRPAISLTQEADFSTKITLWTGVKARTFINVQKQNILIEKLFYSIEMSVVVFHESTAININHLLCRFILADIDFDEYEWWISMNCALFHCVSYVLIGCWFII